MVKVIAKFVDSHGDTIVKASGQDWMQAFDKAYVKILKIPRECRGKIVFEFKKSKSIIEVKKK